MKMRDLSDKAATIKDLIKLLSEDETKMDFVTDQLFPLFSPDIKANRECNCDVLDFIIGELILYDFGHFPLFGALLANLTSLKNNGNGRLEIVTHALQMLARKPFVLTFVAFERFNLYLKIYGEILRHRPQLANGFIKGALLTNRSENSEIGFRYLFVCVRFASRLVDEGTLVLKVNKKQNNCFWNNLVSKLQIAFEAGFVSEAQFFNDLTAFFKNLVDKNRWSELLPEAQKSRKRGRDVDLEEKHDPKRVKTEAILTYHGSVSIDDKVAKLIESRWQEDFSVLLSDFLVNLFDTICDEKSLDEAVRCCCELARMPDRDFQSELEVFSRMYLTGRHQADFVAAEAELQKQYPSSAIFAAKFPALELKFTKRRDGFIRLVARLFARENGLFSIQFLTSFCDDLVSARTSGSFECLLLLLSGVGGARFAAAIDKADMLEWFESFFERIERISNSLSTLVKSKEVTRKILAEKERWPDLIGMKQARDLVSKYVAELTPELFEKSRDEFALILNKTRDVLAKETESIHSRKLMAILLSKIEKFCSAAEPATTTPLPMIV